MKTYLSMILEGSELKKYVSKVNTVRQENGISKQMIASSSFYFNKSELIKVEEFIIEGDKERHADWYYSNDKPLYYALPSDRSEERANFLLTLSKTFLKQIQK
ncbi:MAG: hypothetical protein ABI863_17885 [Ginsengibacter sp.]